MVTFLAGVFLGDLAGNFVGDLAAFLEGDFTSNDVPYNNCSVLNYIHNNHYLVLFVGRNGLNSAFALNYLQIIRFIMLISKKINAIYNWKNNPLYLSWSFPARRPLI